MSTVAKSFIVTVDAHGEIHVPAADAARIGVQPGQRVVLAPVAAAPLRPAPKVTVTIAELATKQGKTETLVVGADHLPQLIDTDGELAAFQAAIGPRR